MQPRAPASPRRTRPTSFDIAELAGVSQSTVSRALRDSAAVSLETRLRVAEAARSLNYKVDVNARNLRSQRTSTLALLLCEDPGAGESGINPFFLSMLGSITRASARRGYDLVVSFQQASGDWSADYGSSNRADGIIFLGYGDYQGYVSRLERLDAEGVRHITWGPVIAGQPGRFLGSDNIGGARAATAHLLDLGRRRIAFLGDGSECSPEFRQRREGWLLAHREAAAPPCPTLQASAINSEAEGRRAMLELLASGEPVDAVVAASDLIAIGAMRALGERGLRTPEDVAVVGFDDIYAASWTNPPLTTVRQDTAAAGALLVDGLLRLIDGRPVETSSVPTELIVRASCGAAQRA